MKKTIGITILVICNLLTALAEPTFYDQLVDQRSAPIGPKNWMGNLKWYAEEVDRNLTLAFRTNPKDQTAAEYAAQDQIQSAPDAGAAVPSARRTFFRLGMQSPAGLESCTYRPDGVTAVTKDLEMSVFFPLQKFGTIVECEQRTEEAETGLLIENGRLLGSRLVTPSELKVLAGDGSMTWTDGIYTLVFRFDGILKPVGDKSFSLKPKDGKRLRLAVAFHLDSAKAKAEAELLFGLGDEVLIASRSEWNEYLESCPVTDYPKGYSYRRTANGPEFKFSGDELRQRQLWHWVTTLINIYDIDFNNMPALMTPDKSTWFGCWSNDSAEALRALAYTNQKKLVHKCLVDYVRVGINADGDMTWYLHGTGVRAFGNPRDLGRLSHAVPCVITAIGEYIQGSGDARILDEPADDNMTVWEKIQRYWGRVYSQRDLDGDGLIEWRQLWETGEDDKLGPFFSSAPIGEWCRAIEKMGPDEFKAFHKGHVNPVATLGEQMFFYDALQATSRLANLKKDKSLAGIATERMARIIRVINDRHWDENQGFYYDWDVIGGKRVDVKNLDAFYVLPLLGNKPRAQRVIKHLDNPDEFGTPYLPTAAKNSPGFRADGYWCGGNWPREAGYVALGLLAAGDRKRAEMELIKALTTGTGRESVENVNPLTGKRSTPNVCLAYHSLLCVVLKSIVGHE